MQEHERRARARLAVGDARAVGVVVEAQLHPVASPARCPRASAAATRAPAPSSTRGRALDVALQLGVDARRARARRGARRRPGSRGAARRRASPARAAAERWSAARVSTAPAVCRSASLRALATHCDSRVPDGSVTGARGAGQRALDGAGRAQAGAVERRARRPAGRQRDGGEQREGPDHGRIVEWPRCAAPPTTARSCGWRCPPSARWPPSRCTCWSTRRSSATSARRSWRRSRSRRPCSSNLVALCIFLTYGTTARVTRLHGAGRDADAARARPAGALARARRRRGGRGRRGGAGRAARARARRRRPRRGPGGALPAHRLARPADGARRARRPGLAARDERPAHAAGHRGGGQRRQRRARAAVRLRLRLGPRRLGVGHGARPARDGRRVRDRAAARVRAARPRAHPLAACRSAPSSSCAPRRCWRASCSPPRSARASARRPSPPTRSPSSSSASSPSCSTRSPSPGRSSSGARSAPATPTRPSPPRGGCSSCRSRRGCVIGGVFLALADVVPRALHLRPRRHRPGPRAVAAVLR